MFKLDLERGTGDHIVYLCWLLGHVRNFQKKIIMCLIDYRKTFDCVDPEKL